MPNRYSVPQLPYAYNALEPYISEKIMQLHHDKHHAAYVNGANSALDKLEKARKGGGKPGGALADKIEASFGGFDKFKAQFSDAAKTVEGSGWALLLYDPETDQLVLTQIEKQNFMHLAQMTILLGLDVWEHAYYLDYLNDRAKCVDNWWNVVNWSDVDSRLSKAKR